MAEIYQLPESNSGNNATIPFSIPIGFGGMGNNGFGFGNGGFGNNNGGGFGSMPPMPKLDEKNFESAQTEIKPE